MNHQPELQPVEQKSDKQIHPVVPGKRMVRSAWWFQKMREAAAAAAPVKRITHADRVKES